MGEKSPAAENKGEGVRANQRNRLIRMVKRRSDTDALLDAMRAEGDWYWAAHGMKPVDPLLERCRPVMRAAFEDFLNDRARWADDVITAAEDGFRLNRLFDGERFVRDRADAVLKMGWLMAYYYPKDNPLSEAQCKRATALGILKNWDRRSPVKIEDDVVLGLAYLLNDLDPKEPRYDGPGVIFPRHVGLEGAMTELQRWFRVVVGRDFEGPIEEQPAKTKADRGTESTGEIVSSNDERDAWLYEKDCNGIPAAQILIELKPLAKQKGWGLISSWPSIRRATKAYAQRKGLPPPPVRQQKQR